MGKQPQAGAENAQLSPGLEQLLGATVCAIGGDRAGLAAAWFVNN